VAFDFAFPAAFCGIVSELPLQAEAFAEPRRVLRGGDELGAGQVEVAFARAFLGQAQAVPEFQLGLVEVGLEPVQGVLPERDWSAAAVVCAESLIVNRAHGVGTPGPRRRVRSATPRRSFRKARRV
jgi:hypothetical protein